MWFDTTIDTKVKAVDYRQSVYDELVKYHDTVAKVNQSDADKEYVKSVDEFYLYRSLEDAFTYDELAPIDKLALDKYKIGQDMSGSMIIYFGKDEDDAVKHDAIDGNYDKDTLQYLALFIKHLHPEKLNNETLAKVAKNVQINAEVKIRKAEYHARQNLADPYANITDDDLPF